MREQITVVYENGVLRPVEPLPTRLQEHQRLTVTLEDSEASARWLADANPAVSLDDVRRALAKVSGTLAEAVHAEREER